MSKPTSAQSCATPHLQRTAPTITIIRGRPNNRHSWLACLCPSSSVHYRSFKPERNRCLPSGRCRTKSLKIRPPSKGKSSTSFPRLRRVASAIEIIRKDHCILTSKIISSQSPIIPLMINSALNGNSSQLQYMFLNKFFSQNSTT